MEILWHYEDGKYAIFGVKQMHTKKITEVAVTINTESNNLTQLKTWPIRSITNKCRYN